MSVAVDRHSVEIKLLSPTACVAKGACGWTAEPKSGKEIKTEGSGQRRELTRRTIYSITVTRKSNGARKDWHRCREGNTNRAR